LLFPEFAVISTPCHTTILVSNNSG